MKNNTILILIIEDVIIVPYANPIGLSQLLFGNNIGRFSFDNAINFNRDFLDLGINISPNNNNNTNNNNN